MQFSQSTLLRKSSLHFLFSALTYLKKMTAHIQSSVPIVVLRKSSYPEGRTGLTGSFPPEQTRVLCLADDPQMFLEMKYMLAFRNECRDRGAWWAAVYGVAQSRTRLKWLSSSSSSSSIFHSSGCFCFPHDFSCEIIDLCLWVKCPQKKFSLNNRTDNWKHFIPEGMCHLPDKAVMIFSCLVLPWWLVLQVPGMTPLCICI